MYRFGEPDMANSLQDQLLKAGIINKQKASKVNAEKRKKVKQSRQTKVVAVDENKAAIQLEQAEKADRDRQLNQQHQTQLQRKAIDAQIRQLIVNNRKPQNDSDIAYNFADNNIVKKYMLPSCYVIKSVTGKWQLLSWMTITKLFLQWLQKKSVSVVIIRSL
jgi:uncharacterized protein YaiL (DUF2058 family)